MSIRSTVFPLLVGTAAVLLSVACFTPGPPPPKPGVAVGDDQFERQAFADLTLNGLTTDILSLEIGTQRIGIAAEDGVAWLDENGAVTSVQKLPKTASGLRIVDLEADGTFEFLDDGELDGVVLLDSQGKAVWKFPGEAETCLAMSIRPGDLDGDGRVDFIVACDDGLRRIDQDGKVIWTKPVTELVQVEILDTNHDGISEIAASTNEGALTIHDAAGDAVKILADEEGYFFAVVNPAADNELAQIVVPGEGEFRLLSISDEDPILLPAPSVTSYSPVLATRVKFTPDRPADLAVLVYPLDGTSTLYLYDADRKLVFQEVLNKNCTAMAAVARPGGGQRLLVGSKGMVWEYRPKN